MGDGLVLSVGSGFCSFFILVGVVGFDCVIDSKFFVLSGDVIADEVEPKGSPPCNESAFPATLGRVSPEELSSSSGSTTEGFPLPSRVVNDRVLYGRLEED